MIHPTPFQLFLSSGAVNLATHVNYLSHASFTKNKNKPHPRFLSLEFVFFIHDFGNNCQQLTPLKLYFLSHQTEQSPSVSQNPSEPLPSSSVSLHSKVCIISAQSEQTNHSHQSCQHHDSTASKHVPGAAATFSFTCS